MIDGTAGDARVRFRVGEDGAESVVRWREASTERLLDARPWRTFRWYHGQQHYSGFYWACTEQDLVIYESRLELARLLLADFDPSVSRIVAQPFLLEAEIEGRLRSGAHQLDHFHRFAVIALASQHGRAAQGFGEIER